MGQSTAMIAGSARTAGASKLQNAPLVAAVNQPLVDQSSDTDSDGDSEDDSSLEGESDSSTDTDDATEDHVTDTSSSKRANSQSPVPGESNRKRRRRIILDETEIKIPLEYGWRRETRIRSVGPRGIMGEVMYHAPCGKKLRSYQEVDRYLERNGISDLTRDNFTFSTKVCVGEFYEASVSSDTQGYTYHLLSDSDVQAHYAVIEARKNKMLERKQRMEKRLQQKRLAADMAMNMSQGRLQRRLQQQELARKVAEIKQWKKWERQRQKEAARRNKEVRLQEIRKQREQQRLLRQQEKVHRQQQIRLEREMRTQQIIEVRWPNTCCQLTRRGFPGLTPSCTKLRTCVKPCLANNNNNIFIWYSATSIIVRGASQHITI
ncbi:hypothetical protein NP493_168g01012 [Ridgeia piscesae]|uniref:MBD domain-containing protein n=1 Tax=Ridgeia piscesae TaxID=27915 RepID=A0AAD9UFF2_RIDPI|nr:hypothetical protein NP493_168g01012 [Ridgeia piscesae]